MHGDVRSLSSDAILLPTRNVNNRAWFPRGPPEGAEPPEREAFTPTERVIRLEGGASERGRLIWLGHLDGRFVPPERSRDGAPELTWFLEAASQFLNRAHGELMARGTAPRCGRAKHVLSMPALRLASGRMEKGSSRTFASSSIPAMTRGGVDAARQ